MARERVRERAVSTAAVIVLGLCLLSGLCNGETGPQDSSSNRLAVAILSFENAAGDANDAHWSEGIAGLLVHELGAVKAARLSSDTAIRYALEKNGLDRGSAIDVNQARAVGECIEVQRVIWGQFRRETGVWQVTLRILNVATGRASPELVARGTDWFAGADTLADAALTYLQIDPNKAEKAKMRRRYTTSAVSLEGLVRGFWLQARGQPCSQQEDSLRHAMEADPNSAAVRVALGATLLNLGKLVEAERLMRQAIAMDPNSFNGHEALAFLFMAQGELAGVEEHMRKSCELDPDDASCAAMLARVMGLQQRWDEAVALAERASRLDPFDSQCRAHLAAIYASQQQRKKALEQLRSAETYCTSGPAGVNTLVVVGETYRQLGEKPKAIDAYREVVAQGRQMQLDPQTLSRIEQKMKFLRASLSPTFIKTDVPKTFSEEALDQALRERLTEDEMKGVRPLFHCTPQMKAWAADLTKDASTDLDKAKALFDGMTRRVEAAQGYQIRTAEEVYAAWNRPAERFWCVDYTALYVALARSLGLKAFVARVDNDPNGWVISHVCAAVFLDDRALLVDASWNWFGVAHRRYEVMDDLQTIALYQMAQASVEKGCRVALKLCPSMPLAKVLSTQYTDPNTARKELETMGEPDPNTFTAYVYWLARAKMAGYSAQYDLAEAHLHKAISMAPTEEQGHYMLGSLLLRQNRLQEAREEYQCCVTASRPTVVEEARRRLAQISEQLWQQSRKPPATDNQQPATNNP